MATASKPSFAATVSKSRTPSSTTTPQSQSRRTSGTATPVSQPTQAPAPVPAAAAASTEKPQAQQQHQPQPQASSSSSSHPSTSSAASNMPTDFGSMLGSHLKLTMIDNKTHTGYLYAFDATMAVVALCSVPEPVQGSPADYNILKSTQVKHVHLIAPSPVNSIIKQWKPPPVNLERVSANVDNAVKADKKREARTGRGVSSFAQGIFDALGKTMPTVWVDQSIQVLDDILIDPPAYEPSACHFKSSAVNSTSAGQQTKLDRVHKVLAGERAKLLAAGVGANGNGAAT